MLRVSRVLRVTPFGVAAGVAQSASSKSVPLMSTLSGAVDSTDEASSMTPARTCWRGLSGRSWAETLRYFPCRCWATRRCPVPGRENKASRFASAAPSAFPPLSRPRRAASGPTRSQRLAMSLKRNLGLLAMGMDRGVASTPLPTPSPGRQFALHGHSGRHRADPEIRSSLGAV